MKKWGRTDTGLFGDSPPCSGDTAAKKADFVERCLLVNGNHRNICDDGVLREGRSTHLNQGSLHWCRVEVGQTYEVVDWLPIDAEATRVVGHQAFALCGAD
jgi:hypothetical protein